MNSISQYLCTLGYRPPRDDNYDNIRKWRDWYSTNLDEVHKRTFFNGINQVDDPMKQLGMAKHICEDWANLIMNEKVVVTTGIDSSDDKLQEILDANDFRVNANQLVEKYMALGTGAFVEYLHKGEVRLDYIQADMIFPLSWDNRGVSECAFGSTRQDKDGKMIYLQIHTHPEPGKQHIENHMLRVDGDGENSTFKEIPLPAGMEPSINADSDLPLFQIVKPNILNNYDLSCPLGMSVYGNCLDILEAADAAFDALHTEVVTGRRKVFFSSDLWQKDSQGRDISPMETNEKAFRYIPSDIDSEGGNPFVMDYTPNIRAQELKDLLQQQISLLSLKCGMGTNQYEFSMQGAKTATEVISEDSDMYVNLRKHELVLETALKRMVTVISKLANFPIKEISIDFDDSIIEDKATERKNDQADLANGTFLPWEYRAKWRNESEETAKANIETPPTEEVLD